MLDGDMVSSFYGEHFGWRPAIMLANIMELAPLSSFLYIGLLTIIPIFAQCSHSLMLGACYLFIFYDGMHLDGGFPCKWQSL